MTLRHLLHLTLFTSLLACQASPSSKSEAKKTEAGATKPDSKALSPAPEQAASPAANPAKTRGAEKPGSHDKKPNVVVILIDTLRPDYLGFYGYEYETAPFLASLAGKSAVCDNAYSTSSWTAPATASLFTSLYPPQHTVVQGFKAHRSMVAALEKDEQTDMPLNQIPSSITTMSERLQKAGYATYGFAANINIGSKLGFDRGFDHFERHVRKNAAYFYGQIEKQAPELKSSAPYFLYVHLNDVHLPYHKHKQYFRPATERRMDRAARYRSEISYVDAWLKKLYALLDMDEDTLLVILSDHGEEFWDHGGTEHGPKLYRELMQVLMMFHGPDLGIGPTRVFLNTSLIDVFPTLMDALALEKPQPAEGMSLWPMLTSSKTQHETVTRLEGRALFGHRIFSTRRKLAVWAIIQNKWHLIRWWDRNQKLFDKRHDMAEEHDLREKHPELSKQLERRLTKFQERLEKNAIASEQVEVELDQELLDKLKELGYVE